MEPTEQSYLPNVSCYVLPPTPSDSSSDTAPSPCISDHGKHNGQFYNGYYNTLSKDANSSHQQYKNRNLEQSGFQMDSHHLENPPTQQQHTHGFDQTQYQSNHTSPTTSRPNQETKIPSDQLNTSVTPPFITSEDNQEQKLKKKRPRTLYASFQVVELERAFQESKYLTKLKRIELAEKLQLSESRVKVWYQNRRTKERKYSGDEQETYKIWKARQMEELLDSKATNNLNTSQASTISAHYDTVPTQLSTSVTNQLLTHSVWVKENNQHMSSVGTNYRPYITSTYYGAPYSSTFHSIDYSSPNNYYSSINQSINNQFHGQQNYNEKYFMPHPDYQHNNPTSFYQSKIKKEEKFNTCLSSQEDLTINFAIAQEFLSKAMMI